MRTKLMIIGLMTTALAGMLLLSGCVGSGEEQKALKAQIQQTTERTASMENQIKRLRDDMEAILIEMGNQKQAGGVSPELARRIDEMSMKMSAIEASLGDVNKLKTALAEKPRTTTVAAASAAASDSAAAPAPAPRTQKTGVYHQVAQGETLTSIAQKYGTTIAAIRKENGLPQNAIIRTGTKLYVPTDKQQ